MKSITSKTIVFITGAFVTHEGWGPWRSFFESNGYKTIAPPWPNKEGTAKELRDRQPNDTALGTMGLREVTDSYANIVKSLPEKPILIGHSLGGLMTQILVSQDLAAAGVAIHSVPPLGVIPIEFSFYKAGGKALGLFTSVKKTYLMSLKDWQYAFTNGMTLEEQKDSYEKNTIPESKQVTRDGLSSAAKVDFRKPHVPLLLTSGDKDNIIPASLNYRNFKAYKKNNGSVTDYKEFKGRNHFVLGQPSWKEDAEYILNWIKEH